jgi:hypothetical protein
MCAENKPLAKTWKHAEKCTRNVEKCMRNSENF